MVTIKLKDHDVYTQGLNDISEIDFESAKQIKELIDDAFFFVKDDINMIKKVDFNYDLIKNRHAGLMINLRKSSIPLFGHNKIKSFLNENNVCESSLSNLSGKSITAFKNNSYILGLSSKIN